MFNISEFKAKIGKYGIAKTSSYAVNITPPSQLSDSFINDLPYLVTSANLPGINLRTEDIRHKGYGVIESRPVEMTFEPITLTIIGDGSGKVLDFLQKWMSMIYNFDGESPSNSYGIPSEFANYPNLYWGVLELYLYDITSYKYTTYKFSKSHPTNIGAVQVGWDQSNQFMQIPVTFNYRTYTTTATESLAVTSSDINTLRDSNARNIEQIEKLLTSPNTDQYKQRLLIV